MADIKQAELTRNDELIQELAKLNPDILTEYMLNGGDYTGAIGKYANEDGTIKTLTDADKAVTARLKMENQIAELEAELGAITDKESAEYKAKEREYNSYVNTYNGLYRLGDIDAKTAINEAELNEKATEFKKTGSIDVFKNEDGSINYAQLSNAYDKDKAGITKALDPTNVNEGSEGIEQLLTKKMGDAITYEGKTYILKADPSIDDFSTQSDGGRIDEDFNNYFKVNVYDLESGGSGIITLSYTSQDRDWINPETLKTENVPSTSTSTSTSKKKKPVVHHRGK